MKDTAKSLVHTLTVALNEQEVTRLKACLAPDYVDRNITLDTTLRGLSDIHLGLAALYAAFPDVAFRIHGHVAGKGNVVVFWSMSGTHRGTFRRIPPTGLKVSTVGSSMFSLDNGRLTAGTHIWDLGCLLRSMRLLPQLPARRSTRPGDTVSAFLRQCG